MQAPVIDPASPPAAVAPPVGTRFMWPAGFGPRFSIFIDTEEEFDWNAPFSRNSRAVSAIQSLPDMHRRFAERGVPLTYLIDYPVASDPAAVATLRALMDDGVSAIGAHLHPWVNPPHEERVTRVNSFAGNLPPELEAAKLDVLGDAIERGFGARPQVFRAGRYGMGPATMALLAARGYVIDSSMRAGFTYTEEGGPDFRRVGNHAFRTGPDGALLELPLTTVYVGSMRRGGPALHDALGRVPRGRGLASRFRMFGRVALTPEQVTLPDVLRAIDQALDDGVALLNFSFHSPTIVPGMTPYIRDDADLSAFYRWWDAVLDRLERRGVRPVGVRELVQVANASRLPSQPAIR